MGSLLTSSPADLAALEERVTTCRRCPRLVAWREQVARESRAAFADEAYWGRPVPGFGDPPARVLSSASRRPPTAPTGPAASSPATARATSSSRRCTATGFASQPTSRTRDGLRAARRLDHRRRALRAAGQQADAAASATPACRGRARARAAAGVRVIVCLGAFAWDAALRLRARRPVPRPSRASVTAPSSTTASGLPLLGCFHPSQQNTFTGKPDARDGRRRAAAGPGSGMGRRADGARTLDEMPLSAFTPAVRDWFDARVRGADGRARRRPGRRSPPASTC